MDLTKDNPKDGLHRLEDILVEEVSLVDRAANKRKFLVVKRSGEMDRELVPDGSGGFTNDDEAIAKAKATAEKEEDDAKKSKADAEKAKAEEAKKAKKPAKPGRPPVNRKTDDDEEEEAKAQKKADDAKAKADADAKVKADAEKKPPFLGKVTEARKALFDLAVDQSLSTDQITEALAKINNDLVTPDVEPVEKADYDSVVTIIEKAGARMSKDRFKRFKQAIELLSSVFGELSPPDMSAPEPPAAGKKAKAKKSDDTPPATFDAEEAIEKLTGAVASIATVVGINKVAMAAVAKSRGAGNAIPVEKSTHVEADNVSWPLDLNNDVRERVGKSNYFD